MNDCQVCKKLEETKSEYSSRLNQHTQKLLKRDADALMATVFLQNVAEWQKHRLWLPALPEVQGCCPVLFVRKAFLISTGMAEEQGHTSN